MKRLFNWIIESMGPGIPEPEPYEINVTDALREQALGMVRNGDKLANGVALKILVAFQLDSEADRAQLHTRIRSIEKHWIFRRATIVWVAVAVVCIAVLVWQHAAILDLSIPTFDLPPLFPPSTPPTVL